MVRRTTQTTRTLNVFGWIVVLLSVGVLTLLLYPAVAQRPAQPAPVITPPAVPAAPPIQTPFGPVALPPALQIALLAAVGLGVAAGMGIGLALLIFVWDRAMAASKAHATEAPPAQPEPLTATTLPPPQPPTPLTPTPIEQQLDRWGDQPLRLPRLTSPQVIVPLIVLVIVGGAAAFVLAGQGLLGGGVPAAQPPPASPLATVQPTAAPPTAAPVQPTAPASGGQTSVGTGISAPLPPGDAGRGQQLFNGAQPLANGSTAGCQGCHGTGVGPDLQGIATRAGTRESGLSAEQYLHESIVQPNAFIVDGFQPNVMPQDFGQRMSAQDLADIIAYLLTLK